MESLATHGLSLPQIGSIVVVVGGSILGFVGYLIRWGLGNLMKSFQIVLDSHTDTMKTLHQTVQDNHKETLGRIELLECQITEQKVIVATMKAQHSIFHPTSNTP